MTNPRPHNFITHSDHLWAKSQPLNWREREHALGVALTRPVVLAAQAEYDAYHKSKMAAGGKRWKGKGKEREAISILDPRMAMPVEGFRDGVGGRGEERDVELGYWNGERRETSDEADSSQSYFSALSSQTQAQASTSTTAPTTTAAPTQLPPYPLSPPLTTSPPNRFLDISYHSCPSHPTNQQRHAHTPLSGEWDDERPTPSTSPTSLSYPKPIKQPAQSHEDLCPGHPFHSQPYPFPRSRRLTQESQSQLTLNMQQAQSAWPVQSPYSIEVAQAAHTVQQWSQGDEQQGRAQGSAAPRRDGGPSTQTQTQRWRSYTGANEDDDEPAGPNIRGGHVPSFPSLWSRLTSRFRSNKSRHEDDSEPEQRETGTKWSKLSALKSMLTVAYYYGDNKSFCQRVGAVMRLVCFARTPWGRDGAGQGRGVVRV